MIKRVNLSMLLLFVISANSGINELTADLESFSELAKKDLKRAKSDQDEQGAPSLEQTFGGALGATANQTFPSFHKKLQNILEKYESEIQSAEQRDLERLINLIENTYYQINNYGQFKDLLTIRNRALANQAISQIKALRP